MKKKILRNNDKNTLTPFKKSTVEHHPNDVAKVEPHSVTNIKDDYDALKILMKKVFGSGEYKIISHIRTEPKLTVTSRKIPLKRKRSAKKLQKCSLQAPKQTRKKINTLRFDHVAFKKDIRHTFLPLIEVHRDFERTKPHQNLENSVSKKINCSHGTVDNAILSLNGAAYKINDHKDGENIKEVQNAYLTEIIDARDEESQSYCETALNETGAVICNSVNGKEINSITYATRLLQNGSETSEVSKVILKYYMDAERDIFQRNSINMQWFQNEQNTSSTTLNEFLESLDTNFEKKFDELKEINQGLNDNGDKANQIYSDVPVHFDSVSVEESSNPDALNLGDKDDVLEQITKFILLPSQLSDYLFLTCNETDRESYVNSNSIDNCIASNYLAPCQLSGHSAFDVGDESYDNNLLNSLTFYNSCNSLFITLNDELTESSLCPFTDDVRWKYNANLKPEDKISILSMYRDPVIGFFNRPVRFDMVFKNNRTKFNASIITSKRKIATKEIKKRKLIQRRSLNHRKTSVRRLSSDSRSSSKGPIKKWPPPHRCPKPPRMKGPSMVKGGCEPSSSTQCGAPFPRPCKIPRKCPKRKPPHSPGKYKLPTCPPFCCMQCGHCYGCPCGRCYGWRWNCGCRYGCGCGCGCNCGYGCGCGYHCDYSKGRQLGCGQACCWQAPSDPWNWCPSPTVPPLPPTPKPWSGENRGPPKGKPTGSPRENPSRKKTWNFSGLSEEMSRKLSLNLGPIKHYHSRYENNFIKIILMDIYTRIVSIIRNVKNPIGQLGRGGFSENGSPKVRGFDPWIPMPSWHVREDEVINPDTCLPEGKFGPPPKLKPSNGNPCEILPKTYIERFLRLIHGVEEEQLFLKPLGPVSRAPARVGCWIFSPFFQLEVAAVVQRLRAEGDGFDLKDEFLA
ncbi:hypothetical protein EVAR_23384_1 [Eumeta japonica]|uniref:Uncharacterized protein n=1 Tax=Eumeta variegata TaxID=151549 RepID=A0A4C1VUA0_EUMVA|nr:hypothetical protein EVAR_23384_1 [Eumeta japonica]